MLHTQSTSETRIAPLGILALAFGVGVAVILAVVLLAARQPALDVTFSLSPDGKAVLAAEHGRDISRC